MTDFSGLTQQAVRDLYWACNSAAIVEFDDYPLPPVVDRDWFSYQDQHPGALLDHLQQGRSHFLGAYFEALWEFYLTHSPDTELFAKNLQVSVGAGNKHSTLGEYDFIYYCKRRQRYVHLEVAVKFYLGVLDNVADKADENGDGGLSNMSRWLGPQKKDRLDLKYNKMLDRQLVLSRTSPGMNVLREAGIEQEVLVEACIRGVLFYPWLSSGKTMPPPINSSVSHNRGDWVTLLQLDEYRMCEKIKQWKPLPDKSNWLSGEIHSRVCDYQQLVAEMRDTNTLSLPMKPRMFEAWSDRGCQRLFVVHDEWQIIE